MTGYFGSGDEAGIHTEIKGIMFHVPDDIRRDMRRLVRIDTAPNVGFLQTESNWPPYKVPFNVRLWRFAMTACPRPTKEGIMFSHEPVPSELSDLLASAPMIPPQSNQMNARVWKLNAAYLEGRRVVHEVEGGYKVGKVNLSDDTGQVQCVYVDIDHPNLDHLSVSDQEVALYDTSGFGSCRVLVQQLFASQIEGIRKRFGVHASYHLINFAFDNRLDTFVPDVDPALFATY